MFECIGTFFELCLVYKCVLGNDISYEKNTIYSIHNELTQEDKTFTSIFAILLAILMTNHKAG